MKRRIVSLLLVLAMLIASLAIITSCGPIAVASDLTTYEFDTSTPVTITFYHTMGESLRAVLDKYIVKFNELYPNITVKHEQVGGYDDVREQIKTEITVGDQPNIAYCYPDHVALYNLAQAVQTLDGLIASTETVTRADGTTEVLGLTQAQIDRWDNPIHAGAHCIYLERDIQSRLNHYAKDEDITDMWIWAEAAGNDCYGIYIGYA